MLIYQDSQALKGTKSCFSRDHEGYPELNRSRRVAKQDMLPPQFKKLFFLKAAFSD